MTVPPRLIDEWSIGGLRVQYHVEMVHERTVGVGSRTVRYLETGAGWPLVLLHAFPLSSDMWRPQLAHRFEGWRLLAPDLRGFGPAASDAARRLEDMVEDVVGWLDVLRIDRAAIGGSSMGGYVTLTLFRSAPERFSALVLANTKATADTAEGRAGRDRMSSLVREKGPSAVADEMIPKLLGETSRRDRLHLESGLRQLIEANTAQGIDGAIQSMKNRPDSTDMLQRIDRPALVLAGAEDTLIPFSESETMHGLIPRSQLVCLPRAGHVSNLETPDDFSEALANFLRAAI